MSRAYFTDAAVSPALHTEHVEHEELELTDEELARLKKRARRAVTMDTAGERALPGAYRAFLDGGTPTRDGAGEYAAFLRGEHR